jgi:hypothetical protein
MCCRKKVWWPRGGCLVTRGDLVHVSEWIVAIWRFHTKGTQGKGTTGEISNTILYVNRLWKPPKEILSIKPSEKGVIGGKVLFIFIVFIEINPLIWK